MPENDRTDGRADAPLTNRTDAPYTEAATGAESTYVHGGQRALENPPRTGAADVSLRTQDELNEMHVDSKLQSGQSAKPAPLPTENDEFGRSPEQMAELNKQREAAFDEQDKMAGARGNHIDALADVHNDIRDRTLAVQEEISTRERDGAMPGTPAFERRKHRIRAIVGQSEEDEASREKDHGDRLQVIAASLHTATPAGIEDAQRQLMALAAEMHGDPDGSKGAKERVEQRARTDKERDQDRVKMDQKIDQQIKDDRAKADKARAEQVKADQAKAKEVA